MSTSSTGFPFCFEHGRLKTCPWNERETWNTLLTKPLPQKIAIFRPVIVARYILKEHTGPFFFGFAVVTLVLVMDFILEIMQSIITKGVGVWEVLEIFGLNLAWMLALSVPMSVLVATIMAFGRLASDSEILALKAGGWSWRRLAAPALLWGAAMAFLMYLFNDYVLPESNHQARMKLSALAQKKPLLTLQPNVFNNQIPGYQIYMKDINPLTNDVSEVRIFEQRPGQLPRTISAPKGRVYVRQPGLTRSSEGVIFELYNGEVAEADPKDPTQFRRVFFDRQKVVLKDVSQPYYGGTDNYRGEREMNIQMMRERIAPLEAGAENFRQKLMSTPAEQIRAVFFGESKPNSSGDGLKNPLERERRILAELQQNVGGVSVQKSQINAYWVEIHKKYSLAAACFVFVLVGAPLGAAVRKSGFGTAAGLSLGFFIFYWACLIGGEELADRGKITPFWAMWFANVVLAAIGIFFFYRMEKENRIRIWDWTQEQAARLAALAKRIFQPGYSK